MAVKTLAGLGTLLGLVLSVMASDLADVAPEPQLAGPAEERFEVPEHDALIDPVRSVVSFAVRMRWFSRVQGRFGRFRGVVAALDGGQRRVEVEVDVASLDVAGRRRMTDWASSEEFFDVGNHPVIVFVSDPFEPVLAIQGGMLLGDLSLRGTTRRVAFDMLPTACARPGHGCPIIVEGAVSRGAFGMESHRVAVQDRVELRFEVLLAVVDP